MFCFNWKKNRNSRCLQRCKCTSTLFLQKNDENKFAGNLSADLKNFFTIEMFARLTSSYWDFASEYSADAVGSLASVYGGVYITPIRLTAKGQKVHRAIDQHFPDVWNRMDLWTVPHEPVHPRYWTSPRRAVYHCSCVVGKFHGRTGLRGQHWSLAVQNYPSTCNNRDKTEKKLVPHKKQLSFFKLIK